MKWMDWITRINNKALCSPETWTNAQWARNRFQLHRKERKRRSNIELVLLVDDHDPTTESFFERLPTFLQWLRTGTGDDEERMWSLLFQSNFDWLFRLSSESILCYDFAPPSEPWIDFLSWVGVKTNSLSGSTRVLIAPRTFHFWVLNMVFHTVSSSPGFHWGRRRVTSSRLTTGGSHRFLSLFQEIPPFEWRIGRKRHLSHS